MFQSSNFLDSNMVKTSLVFISLILSFVKCHVIFDQHKEKIIPKPLPFSSVTKTKLNPYVVNQGKIHNIKCYLNLDGTTGNLNVKSARAALGTDMGRRW